MANKRALHIFGEAPGSEAELLWVTSPTSEEAAPYEDDERTDMLVAVPGKVRVPILCMKLKTVEEFARKPPREPDGWLPAGSFSVVFFLSVAEWDQIMGEVWHYQHDRNYVEERLYQEHCQRLKERGQPVDRNRGRHRVKRQQASPETPSGPQKGGQEG